MANNFGKNWTTNNNNYPLDSKEVDRYLSVKPSENQLTLVEKPFYTFMHFGMNTATDREWGAGVEKASDFTIKSINAKQWVDTAKQAGATGVILTCKHHDGFCLWPSEYTDFCVKNSSYNGDIVKEVSDECHKQGMDFGVYLSPWDMNAMVQMRIMIIFAISLQNFLLITVKFLKSGLTAQKVQMLKSLNTTGKDIMTLSVSSSQKLILLFAAPIFAG